MNPSTALARAVLDELVHQGVREVVLAPGSRSAPLAFAALRLAEAGRVRLHVRVDERSAGFLALGLAKVSGEPVAVMCTSGSAVANLAPAVVEASYSAVPLVVVTADRPTEARGVGAPQTIDQVGFFGGMVRFAADLGAPRHADPDDPEGPHRAARAAVGSAIAAAMGAASGQGAARTGSRDVAHAGPVHLNIGFRFPLVPDPALDPDPEDEGAASTRPAPDETPTSQRPPGDGSAAHAPRAGNQPGPPGEGVADTREHRFSDRPPRPRRRPFAGCVSTPIDELLGDIPARGVLLVGDLPCSALGETHQWLAELATACGWPIVAEPSANLHGAPTALGHGVLVLGSAEFLASHTPDLVLSVGLFGLSRPTMELLRRARRHVAIELPIVGREVCDPVRTATTVLPGIPLPPVDPRPDPTWLRDWQSADTAASEVARDHLANSATLTASAVTARLWSRVPGDALLLVAASWPVRLLEAFGGRRSGPRVIGNRGANGIDGLVSTAWGAALAHQRPIVVTASDGDLLDETTPEAMAGSAMDAAVADPAMVSPTIPTATRPTHVTTAAPSHSRRPRPAFALLGDLAFLHDHNGLLVGPDEPRPDLVIVVTDNDGGGIFHQLEQGRPEHAAGFERLFGTPLGRDLVAVAEATGVPAVRVRDLTELDGALDAASAAGGVRVIVADVPDRRGEAALLEQVRSAVIDRLWTLS